MLTRFTSLLIGLLAGLVLLPSLALLTSVISPQWDVWQHLSDTVLLDYVRNSALLALGVATGTALIGVTSAWVVTQYKVPGQGMWHWLLLMPLAMPAYIIAYTYTGILETAGPVQTTIRTVFNLEYGDYWFPEIRSLSGAIILMSLVLYPYVFVLAKSAFLEQSRSLEEVTKTFGLSRIKYFLRVALPMARPAVFTGVALAMMEALADYGTVKYFGISTFTTGIFRTWFGLGNEQAAAQLSLLLTGTVLLVLLLERHSRRAMSYSTADSHYRPQPLRQLSKRYTLGLVVVLSIPVLLGFILPLIQLVIWTIDYWVFEQFLSFVPLLVNSVSLAVFAALLTVFVAILLCYLQRNSRARLTPMMVQLSSIGYAFPGTVIAVGVMMVLSQADYVLNEHLELNVGLLLSGTAVAVIFAYVVRFLAVAIHNVDTGLQRVTPSMDVAARSMGCGTITVFIKIHLPLIRTSVFSAILLVFVDVLKELPATLILRPFDFNTLAIRAFELASDERLAEAALPSVSIVLVGIIPVMLLAKASHRKGREK